MDSGQKNGKRFNLAHSSSPEILPGACPLCHAPVAAEPRYPRRVCAACASTATAADGRTLQFHNADATGGYQAVYADTGAAYAGHACFIRGVRCRADEAKFGGIVIQTDAGNPGKAQSPQGPGWLALLRLPAGFWGAAVVLATISGYPGVIFLTPVAWLTALHCGTVAGSKRRALWAGLMLGLFHGLLFGIWTALLLPPVRADERVMAWFWSVLLAVVSPVATAALAVATAWWRFDRRQHPANEQPPAR